MLDHRNSLHARRRFRTFIVGPLIWVAQETTNMPGNISDDFLKVNRHRLERKSQRGLLSWCWRLCLRQPASSDSRRKRSKSHALAAKWVRSNIWQRICRELQVNDMHEKSDLDFLPELALVSSFPREVTFQTRLFCCSALQDSP